MKKTFAVILLMGSVAAVNAQDTQNKDLQRLETTSSYHAKATTNVPSHFQSNFRMTYPDATDVTWYEVHDNWYRAVNNQQGRTLHVYYTPNGSSFMVALPVIQSWVPEEVISTAISKYGHNIYAVNKVKVAGGTDAYQVSIIENGMLRNEWIATDGTAITDVFRTDDIAKETMLDTGNYAGKEVEDTKVKAKLENEDGTEIKKKTKVEMENGMEVKKKTKVEKTDGTEIKTKSKKGKTKVKVDD